MYIERVLTAKLERLFSVFPVVIVTGARQVGKSTLLANTIGSQSDTDTVVFDPVLDVGNARHDPELFLANRSTPLILDEIQYAPELIPVIKRLVDRNRRPGQYILTGSQQWGVLRSAAESLAGRAVFLDLEGFSLAETSNLPATAPWLPEWLAGPENFFRKGPKRLDRERPLFEQLWRGFLPEAHFLPLDTIPDFQMAYQRTYIERDVRLLADISDWQLFGRFLRLAAALTAQEINFSQLGREIGLTPQTARRWLGILQATFQWHEVPAFSGNALKKVSNKPKGFIADTGLACAAQAISTPQAIGGHPLWGRLFETACMAEIRKQCSLLSPKPQMYHWRAFSGAEVDIILEHDGTFYPIEIKASSRPSRRDTMGIQAFRKRYPGLRIAPGLIMAPIEEAMQLSPRDYALPWDTAGTK